jgi:hypothetical protein
MTLHGNESAKGRWIINREGQEAVTRAHMQADKDWTQNFHVADISLSRPVQALPCYLLFSISSENRSS